MTAPSLADLAAAIHRLQAELAAAPEADRLALLSGKLSLTPAQASHLVTQARIDTLRAVAAIDGDDGEVAA